MRRRKGFTLIELLVVIAIIAILAAILFPVFLAARRQSWTAGCTSNMRQFGAAINLYRENNGGYMPQAYNIWYMYNWYPTVYHEANYFNALSGYMRSKGVAICPAKPITKIKESLYYLWTEDHGKWEGVVYTPPMHAWRKDEVRPGWCAHVIWSQGGGPATVSNKKYSGGLMNPDTLNYGAYYNCRGQSEGILLFCMSGTWTIWPNEQRFRDRFPDGIAHGSHDRGTPALFADGHIRFVSWDKVGNL